MFYKLFALFAVLAVAFAAPKPQPQLIPYSGGLGYVYTVDGVPNVISPYSAYTPYAYSAYPANTLFVR